jgi:TRAP-type C4-dicarboxylate transport system permease small subunit
LRIGSGGAGIGAAVFVADPLFLNQVSPAMDVPPAHPDRPDLLDRATGALAMLGGIVAICIAALVCTSVLGRWLFLKPIEGDFEFVRMATAIAVFAFIPYTQARRGHIVVDTFTSWLPRKALAAIDAFWDLCFAAAMGFLAWGLYVGSREARENFETTMQLQLQIWPVILLCAALCAILSLTALATALRLAWGKPK